MRRIPYFGDADYDPINLDVQARYEQRCPLCVMTRGKSQKKSVKLGARFLQRRTHALSVEALRPKIDS